MKLLFKMPPKGRCRLKYSSLIAYGTFKCGECKIEKTEYTDGISADFHCKYYDEDLAKKLFEIGCRPEILVESRYIPATEFTI